MTHRARDGEWSVAGWPVVWSVLLVGQFLLGRRLDGPGVVAITAAVMQAVVLAIPLAALLRGWRVPVWRWGPGRAGGFVAWLLAFSLAMNHLQAIRWVSASWTARGVYDAAAWAVILAQAVAVPLALVAVLSAWTVTRGGSTWKLADAAAVGSGGAALYLHCILKGALNPLARVSPALGDAWLELTCGILPIVLMGAAALPWIRSLWRTRFHPHPPRDVEMAPSTGAG